MHYKTMNIKKGCDLFIQKVQICSTACHYTNHGAFVLQIL